MRYEHKGVTADGLARYAPAEPVAEVWCPVCGAAVGVKDEGDFGPAPCCSRDCERERAALERAGARA